ncbi:MAG TPA: aldolase/citrate lyase family protein [Terriglobales bacterium]|nr:aldolase/citrate lyase family protein [Terriglobales bacterium]
MGTSLQHALQIYEAGRSGKDVRSDCRVAFLPQDSGGIAIELKSRVGAYYGDSIRRQAQRTLDTLAIGNCRLCIEDEGALPFVIAARIEAAVKKSGIVKLARALSEAVPLPPVSSKDRLRRSRLYLPGSEPKYFINASLHEPDAIILDLEDSVHPDEKYAARILVRNALRSVSFGRCERMVRINQLPLGLEDLEEVVPEFPDLVLIPKVESAQQVADVAQAIAQIQRTQEHTRPIWLMPILESALGIENAHAIATADESVVALTIGLEDYTADLGVAKTVEGTESLYARTRLVNAAKAAGIQAIDSVFGDVGDIEGLRRWGENSRAVGFEGMGCIHPSQIPIIHDAFAPTEKEIEKALKIVSAYDEAQREGLGVVSLGSKMIDPPVVNRALKLAATARAMGLLDAREASK